MAENFTSGPRSSRPPPREAHDATADKMLNMNAVLFGLQHEVLETTGLGEQPRHLPEPDDGYSEWDNDVSHLLGVDETGDAPERPARPTGTAKVAAISSLFSRISEQAPASARYQQVAVSAISSLVTLYCNMGSTRGDLNRPPRRLSERMYGLSPLAVHLLLIECGLINMLAVLLLKPLPEQESVCPACIL